MPPLAVIGTQELLIVAGIVVLLFGARKIPEVARGLGEGIRGFRHSLKGDEDDDTARTAAGPKETATKGSES